MSCAVDPKNLCGRGLAAYTAGPDWFYPEKYISYCNELTSQLASKALCTGTPINARRFRGGTTLRTLAGAVIPGGIDGNRACSEAATLSASDKVKSGDNYEVSTRTSRGLPRVRVLTLGHGIRSTSLTGLPLDRLSAVVDYEKLGGRSVSDVMCMGSYITPAFEPVFRNFRAPEPNLPNGATE